MKKNVYIYGGIAIFIIVVFLVSINHDDSETVEEIIEKENVSILIPCDNSIIVESFEKICEKYETENNIEIDIIKVHIDNFKKYLLTAQENDELPDIIICNNTYMPSLIKIGIFSDTKIYMQDDYERVFSSFALDSCRKDGKSYGVPLIIDPYVLYSNDDRLKQFNQHVPEDFESLLDVAMNTNQFPTDGIGISLASNQLVTNFFLQFFYSTGDSIRTLKSDGGKKVFDLLRDMVANNLISPESIYWNENDMVRGFLNNEFTMFVGSLSSSIIIDKSSEHIDANITSVPYDKKQVWLVKGYNIGLSADCNNSRALEILEYLISREGIADLASMTNTIGTRVDTPYVNEYDIDISLTDNRMVIERFNNWFEISNHIGESMYQLIIDKDNNVESNLNELQNSVRLDIIND
ncbi:hypothetical protein SH1V18_01400 [Vallitalea longa]|uniref:Extracellular solute-binding protein n=1 Tax=Vallitalea longa TaxID=2936439 RepID=A0A9W6DD75_9FIRM|nr:extracellular solute-binding protein [Vallitalea longa]GKX27660.1 hypothetical protein SH1V18_01400 [Vallitalea longa]